VGAASSQRVERAEATKGFFISISIYKISKNTFMYEFPQARYFAADFHSKFVIVFQIESFLQIVSATVWCSQCMNCQASVTPTSTMFRILQTPEILLPTAD
jgi:hypothetical protein